MLTTFSGTVGGQVRQVLLYLVAGHTTEFQIFSVILEPPGVMGDTCSKFHAENLPILGTTAQYLDARMTCNPGFVHCWHTRTSACICKQMVKGPICICEGVWRLEVRRILWNIWWTAQLVTGIRVVCADGREVDSSWNVMAHIDVQEGKLVNGVGSQYPSHYLGTWCIQHYYRWHAHLGCQQSTELTSPPM